MKNSFSILSALIFSISLSVSTFAASPSTEKIPQTILIKADQNGEIFVHRSGVELQKIKSGDELDQLNFEKLSDVSDKINIKNIPSETQELDSDRPRQSWYVYYGYSYGYYPYYPINYYAYNYNYVYYPYYSYNYGGCNYYWYGNRGYSTYGY